MDNFSLNDETALVFDFDGTMCRLFSNFNLKSTVSFLVETMKEFNVQYNEEQDSFDVFNAIITSANIDTKTKLSALEMANNIICSAEIEAVESGDLVPGVDKFLIELYKRDFKLGIATNNSKECVMKFLHLYCEDIDIPIVGRVGKAPGLMKPNIWSLDQVVKSLKGTLSNTVFIGDTGRDYETASRAGCMFIGMAPTKKKYDRLKEILDKDNIVADYYELSKKLSL